MRILFSIVAYASIATVITIGGGLMYLLNTDRLDDEKMFRIVALMHDVDVEQVMANEKNDELEVPPEEVSLKDVQWRREVLTRDHEVKRDALRRGKQQFDFAYQRLREEMKRFDEIAGELQRQLKKDGELASQDSVEKVVRDLEAVKPDVAKELLLRTLNRDEGINDVIKLMNSMSTSKLKNLLKTFRTEDELEKLDMIHQVMLKGGADKQEIDRAMQELNSLNAGP